MKVLHIIQRYHPAIGGAEVWCRNLCQFLAQKGIIVKVATINLYNTEEFYSESPLDKRYVKLGKYDYDNNVSVTRYNLWSFVSPGFISDIIRFILFKLKLSRTEIGAIFSTSPHSFEMYFNLFKEIKEADIIHLHALPYFHNLIGYALAKLLRRKIVITPHFHPGHPHYERGIFFNMMNNCDAVIGMTKYEKNYFTRRGICFDKVYVAGNSIPYTNAEPKVTFEDFKLNLFKKYRISEETKKIIFIGRKEPHKGIDTLIEAAKELVNENKGADFCLFLVGPHIAEFGNKLQNLCATNTERLKIIDFGSISDEEKDYLLQLSDVLVLPSQFEAFGIVFLEAWKYQKPVIGSDRGAIPEVINEAGLCVGYGNVCDLKEKIKMILFDKELARRLGAAGRLKVDKKYSLEAIGGKVFNIYSTLIKKRRILIVSHLFPPYAMGGSEIVAYEQSIILAKMGFEIKIFAGGLDNKRKQYTIKRENGKFEILRVNLHNSDFANTLYLNFEKKEIDGLFCNAILEFAPDLIHFHNLYPLSLQLIDEAYKMHIPSVMTLHDYWGICFKNTLLTDEWKQCDKKYIACTYCQPVFSSVNNNPASLSERNKKFIEYFNKVNLLISPSRYLINRFIECGISSAKTAVINNGINISRFSKKSNKHSNKIRFGYIGAIKVHKGVENVLKAISGLDFEHKRAMILKIVGTGEGLYIEYCKRLMQEFQILDIVQFLGEIENIKISGFLMNIDVLVVPSIWPENLPVTIMEALASGIPVLASDIGGIPELIEDGVNGFLHKHDDPLSLTENIIKIIRQPNLIRDMRDACLEKVRPFDLTNQVKIIADRYRQLIDCR